MWLSIPDVSSWFTPVVRWYSNVLMIIQIFKLVKYITMHVVEEIFRVFRKRTLEIIYLILIYLRRLGDFITTIRR